MRKEMRLTPISGSQPRAGVKTGDNSVLGRFVVLFPAYHEVMSDRR